LVSYVYACASDQDHHDHDQDYACADVHVSSLYHGRGRTKAHHLQVSSDEPNALFPLLLYFLPMDA